MLTQQLNNLVRSNTDSDGRVILSVGHDHMAIIEGGDATSKIGICG